MSSIPDPEEDAYMPRSNQACVQTLACALGSPRSKSPCCSTREVMRDACTQRLAATRKKSPYNREEPAQPKQKQTLPCFSSCCLCLGCHIQEIIIKSSIMKMCPIFSSKEISSFRSYGLVFDLF